jgi:hypothetical protein
MPHNQRIISDMRVIARSLAGQQWSQMNSPPVDALVLPDANPLTIQACQHRGQPPSAAQYHHAGCLPPSPPPHFHRSPVTSSPSRTGGFACPPRAATLVPFRSVGVTSLRHRRPSFPLWPPWRQVTLFAVPRSPSGAGALRQQARDRVAVRIRTGPVRLNVPAAHAIHIEGPSRAP